METRFATYFVAGVDPVRIVPADNCERRVLITGTNLYLMESAVGLDRIGAAPTQVTYRTGGNIIAFVLRPYQALYALAGDAIVATIGVAVSDHPLACFP